MPCDSIQRSSVNLELRADNKTFLKAALEDLKFYVQYQPGHQGEAEFITGFSAQGVTGRFQANGTLRIEGRTDNVSAFNINQIKRAYSVQVVKAQAKKFGWSLKKTAEMKFAVQKRGF